MTAIATICRDGEIVIAADSRRLNPITGEQTSVCKIRDLTTLFAAVSGINSYDGTKFDLFNLLPSVMPDADIGATADSIRDLLLPPLTVALEHLRTNSPTLLQSCAIEKSPLDISLVRVLDSLPTMNGLSVVVSDEENGPLTITPHRDDWPILGLFATPVSRFVGTTEGVATYLELAKNGDLYNGDIVERARNFVQTEIDKQTPGIDGPIDILRLTAAGASWIQKKYGC